MENNLFIYYRSLFLLFLLMPIDGNYLKGQQQIAQNGTAIGLRQKLPENIQGAFINNYITKGRGGLLIYLKKG
jgi:hypothetical protein